MKINKIKIPIHLKIIAKLYFIAIAIFFFFRFALFFLCREKVLDASFSDIFNAFLMGIRFDVVVSGYLLLIPAVVLSVVAFIGKKINLLERILTIVLTIVFGIAFIVCAADIPYFIQFFNRFNIGAFQWMKGDGGFKFVVTMILEEPRYWLPIIPIICSIVVYYLVVKQIFKKTKEWERGFYFSKSVVTILMLGAILLGIRGRLDEKSPIRVGTAYFCNNSFLNQLGLNPNFTLLKSYFDSKSKKNAEFQFMDDSVALANVRNFLGISDEIGNYPMARKVVYDSLPNHYNVVLVIMESMSAEKMQRHGNTKNLTPFLDSLSYCGLYFDQCFTAGTHTYCGVFSTLCSFPTIYRQQPLKHTPILTYNNIANVLKNNGYSTIYFNNHDSQFDNIGGFLLANDFDRIVSKSDYPSEQIKSTLGVPDDYMFEFSVPILTKLHHQNRPFFATYLTASDHGPYYIPPYFSPHNQDVSEQITEYADYSLRKFIQLSRQEQWFDSTIFVFVADHGYSKDATYLIPISYIHTPLLFYAPNLISESLNNNIAGQIDVFPTIMGLLNISFINNTLGIDLNREQRPYIFATGDDKFAVLDHEWLLIVDYNAPQPTRLYRYKERNLQDFSAENQELVQTMKTYAESNFQTFQYLTRNNLQIIAK